MSETTSTEAYWVARAVVVDTYSGDQVPVTLCFRAENPQSALSGHFFWAREDYALEFRFKSREEAVAVARSRPGPDSLRPERSQITVSQIKRQTIVTTRHEPAITPEEFGER